MKKLRMVEVEWVDSARMGGWRDRKEYLEYSKPDLCKTVGYVLRSNRSAITIIQSLDTSNDFVTDAMTIPRCAVKKIRYLEAHG